MNPSPIPRPVVSASVPFEPDWECLGRLRQGFLDGTAGTQDYWNGEKTVAHYDATFAQRIGWKWDFVLEDLKRLGWTPPAGELVDWGCGSGIASRAFLDHFGVDGVPAVRLVDRSPVAVAYATRRLQAKYPGVAALSGWGDAPSVVLVSHVLTELNPGQIDELLARLAGATAVLWVEPGTYESSLALIAIRERLREELRPVSPCPHTGRCGILAEGNERHWCHHFASPPSWVYMDPFWGQFAHFLGIDLRSLPLSYLVMDRRAPAGAAAAERRMLGRPLVHKADVRALLCDETGVTNVSIPKRTHPDLWKAAKKDRFPTVLPRDGAV